MQGIRHWMASACVACALAAGMAACGGSASKGDGDSNDSGSDGNSASGSDGTSGGSGGSSNGTSAGDGNNASSGNGSGTTGLSMGVPTPVEDYFDAAAAIVCEWLTPCCGDFGVPVNEGNCSTVIASQFAADYASADPDNYTYDPDLGGDCLATAKELYENLGCQLDMTAGEIDPATDELCEQVFQGKLEPGTPCTSDIECAKQPGDEVDCTTLDDSEVNVCVIERRAAEGDSCYWTCTEESGGYFCSGAGASETPPLQGRCYTNEQLSCESGVCARQPGLGEACAANGTCSEGYCVSGICSPGGASGASCQIDSECGEGLYCDSTACAPKKPNGEACELSSECQSESCSDGACADASPDDFAIALLCAVASGQL